MLDGRTRYEQKYKSFTSERDSEVPEQRPDCTRFSQRVLYTTSTFLSSDRNLIKNKLTTIANATSYALCPLKVKVPLKSHCFTNK